VHGLTRCGNEGRGNAPERAVAPGAPADPARSRARAAPSGPTWPEGAYPLHAEIDAQRIEGGLHERRPEEEAMRNRKVESGRVGWILLWALGVPIPVLLVLYALRGCT
jgi:hypothetical protein